jgi:hypothetical protein
MCRRCRARLMIVSAVFGIGKFAQRSKEFVACEGFSNKLPFAIIFSEFALANIIIFRSAWVFVSVIFERVLIFYFAFIASTPNDPKFIRFGKSINSSLKTGDIRTRLAGNWGVRNL